MIAQYSFFMNIKELTIQIKIWNDNETFVNFSATFLPAKRYKIALEECVFAESLQNARLHSFALLFSAILSVKIK